MSQRRTRIGNRIGVWLYRTLRGRLSSGSRHVHVLLLTTPGRHTGIPRSTCVRYLTRAEDQLLVWGTGSGSTSDPDWFRNLRAAGVADVQIGGRHLRAVARELAGADRDRAWREVLREAPEVEKFARRAGRVIPIAVLEPEGS